MQPRAAKVQLHTSPKGNGGLTVAPDLNNVIVLTEDHRQQTLEFLAIRPVHTVVMTSFIADNGMESALHRGRFYGHIDGNGQIDGVALIGHTTLIEARSEEALKAFAFVAKSPETPIHLIMSSGNETEGFFARLTDGAAEPRLTCVEALFEAKTPFDVKDARFEIGTADMDQLLPIAIAQAEIAEVESGINPMADSEAFLRRVARRIEQGRVFSVFEDGKLIFKADIIAETDHTIYLEGVYVHPDHRGEGIGSECLSQLTGRLLNRVPNVCLLSNIRFRKAHRTFESAGYKITDHCVSLFV